MNRKINKTEKSSLAETMPVSLIFVDNFPKELRFENNEFYTTFKVDDDNSAFEQLQKNIKDNLLYNVILSGHETIENAYGLLKSFLDYNSQQEFCFDSSNYPFFLFIENNKLNKKSLYSYFIEKEKEREENLDEELNINSKNILFSNINCNVKEKLNSTLNYYHRKNVPIKSNPYSSPYIKIMYVGDTGTGKSTLINEMNGEKLSYSSSENHIKTKDSTGGRQLTFKNRKYPILNQDTEGFEVGDISQITKVFFNVNKNIGNNFEERLHIIIYLIKNERGLDNNDIGMLAKFHKMKILYYILYPKKEGKDKIMSGKADRLLQDLINKLSNNDYDETINNLLNDFQNKDELLTILRDIHKKHESIIFSSNILAKNSKGKIKLLKKINDDLLKIYEIHNKYIKAIDERGNNTEKVIFGMNAETIDNKDKKDNKYYEILNDSPFFSGYSIDDIKRQEAMRLLNDCEVSSAWLFFYNRRVENYRKELLEKIKQIYSEVKIETEIDNTIFDNSESWFYKTAKTKDFIQKLIKFFDERYKELEKNKKYYAQCEKYNLSIKRFGEYVEEFINFKLNKEPALYDIDLL